MRKLATATTKAFSFWGQSPRTYQGPIDNCIRAMTLRRLNMSAVLQHSNRNTDHVAPNLLSRKLRDRAIVSSEELVVIYLTTYIPRNNLG